MAKYPKKYRKYLVLDATLITIFTGLMVVFLWSIIDAVDLFNPFDDYIDNFEYSDLVYSDMSHKDDIYHTDTNIYIINFGDMNRMELAKTINTIQKYEPRVIGIDAVFKERRDIMGDMMLKQALNAKPNIVMGAFGIYDPEEFEKSLGIIKTNEFFGDLPCGHCELQGNPQTIREFDKFIRFTDSVTNDTIIINSFDAEIIRHYDEDLFLKFATRNKKQVETINYRGGSLPFIILDYEEINDSNQNLAMLKDKIVLLGYVRMFEGAPMDTIDSHFTPLQRCDGYDAKGIEIHAHILSMIINQDYLTTLGYWQNVMIAIVLTFCFVIWLVYYYVYGAKFFDILSKPIQFILIGIVLLISYIMMKNYGIKIDMMPSGIMLIFCIEVLYLYEESLELFKIDTFLTQNFNYTKDERNKVLRSIIRFESIRNKFKRSNK